MTNQQRKRNVSNWVFPADVRGWLHEEEAEFLRDAAVDKVVLELGAYCGKSTIAMAQVAKIVHTVDWFRGDPQSKWQYTLPEFAENIARYKVVPKIVVHAGSISRIQTFLPTNHFDLTFVDMSHDYQSVCSDTKVAWDCTKFGGMIVFHDWNDSVVEGAVRNSLQELGSLYDRLQIDVNERGTMASLTVRE